jgi:hypothetical protein
MDYPVVQWALVILGSLGKIVLLAVILRTRLFKVLPLFTAYVSWRAIEIPIALATVYRYSLASNAYVMAYWGTELVAWVLFSLVILELYENALARYPGLRRLSRVAILWGVGLAMAIVATSVLRAGVVDVPRQWLNSWLYLMSRSISLIQAGLLLTLLVFMQWFRLHAPRALHALVPIWLISRSSDVAHDALRYQFGPSVDFVLALFGPLVSIGTSLAFVWVVIKWSGEKQRRVVFALPDIDSGQAVLNRLEGLVGALRK